MSGGFSNKHKVLVLSGWLGFIATGIYGLRYSPILEFLFTASLICFFSPFFLVMCRNCEKDCPFNLKK